MSNYLAIATVTATLQRVIQDNIQTKLQAAKVTTVRPGEVGSATPESGVNLYLYDISNNPAWRHASDSSIRRSKGEQVKPRVGIDLSYLLSFYGNEIELEPQRLMGSVISLLQNQRILTPDMIRETMADPGFSFIADSDLAEQVESVKIVLLDISTEQLSNIWSVFFQTAYNLSLVYQASTVLIEGEDIPVRALPVSDRSFGPTMFSQQPIIERVIPQAGAYQPILADSTLLIFGKRLKGEVTQVRIGGAEVTPQQVSEKQLSLQLSSLPPDALRAGVQSLQVVHQGIAQDTHQSNTTPVRVSYVESSPVAFVLRPTIIEVHYSNLDENEPEILSPQMTVRVNLVIGKAQRVIVLLNEQQINNPASYTLVVPPREVDTNSLVVSVDDVKAGSYLVRLQVDGAESVLNVGRDPDNPTFNGYIGPKVVISD